MADSQTLEEKDTKPAGADGELQPKTDGEGHSENNAQEEAGESTDYASEVDSWKTRAEEMEKKFSNSSTEAMKLLEYKKQMEQLDELAQKDPRILKWIEDAKEGKVPQVVETAGNLGKKLEKSSYDDYVESIMKDGWSKITKEVEEEFSDVLKDQKIKSRMLDYTKKNIMKTSAGLLVNPYSGKPYTPNEYREVLVEGAILASSGKYLSQAKKEGELKAMIQSKANELATSASSGSAADGKETINLSQEEIDFFRKTGATDDDLPKLAKMLKEKSKK